MRNSLLFLAAVKLSHPEKWIVSSFCRQYTPTNRKFTPFLHPSRFNKRCMLHKQGGIVHGPTCASPANPANPSSRLPVTGSQNQHSRLERHISVSSRDRRLRELPQKWLKSWTTRISDNDAPPSSSKTPPSTNIRRAFSRIPAAAAYLASALVLLCHVLFAPLPASAVSGGRMGGSFGPSSSRSPSPSPSGYSRRASRTTLRAAPATDFARPVVVSSGGSASSAVVSVAFVSIVAYSLLQDDSVPKGPLGEGASVIHLTLAIDKKQDSIINSLRNLSTDVTLTATRKGIQDLLSRVCGELTKNVDNMCGCCLSYKKCETTSSTLRQFARISTEERAKFKRELGAFAKCFNCGNGTDVHRTLIKFKSKPTYLKK
uniref:Uncharacterized protein n=1 Tax=Corethron hystrix TaxID=216773 RepID=A0A7S1BNJ3_9STRA|mmetsp:Transcript_3390/g.6265  ORF Transcript_3390/g.6265 Transcript_3390/m.6265 type:complete len:373 (+) Transcript_3390:122-1240(+)